MTHKALNPEDAALGSLLGALVGDAAGANLEFLGNLPTDEEVERAMTMPGGGVWEIAPGQITDDGELTLCLARALAKTDAFDLEAIANNYAAWVQSHPFDIGLTTSSSLGCFRLPQWKAICDERGYAAAMHEAAMQLCMTSKANGSLMRAVPLGIWGHRIEDDEQLAEYARQDSMLSHPNESCWQAVACYVIAIASLMRQPGERILACDRAYAWANDRANDEVRSWLNDAANNVDVPYHPHIGFAKIAFTHAFRHLYQGTPYCDALSETLSGGGDTDTNACIVGGLIGAACGAAAIPESMQQAVLNCDTECGQHPRPEFLHSQQVPVLARQLLG